LQNGIASRIDEISMIDQRSGAKPNPRDPRGATPGHAAASGTAKPAYWRIGPLALDPSSRALFHDDRLLPLGERAISILLMLIERSGQLVSKDELIAFAWQGLAVEDSNLTVQIAALRRALALVPEGRSWIETMPRRGYRFVGPVAPPGASTDAPASRDTPAEEQRDATLFPTIDSSAHPMVGRDAPLEMLDRITQRMLTGQRQVAFVTGEAGIGKTAFIRMAMERPSLRDVDFLYGRCTERFGTDEAFLPLIDALVTRCRAPDGEELLAAMRVHAPTWILQIPGSIDATEHAAFQHEVFGATRERMLREFCDLLEALSAKRPWILVLEDLHWSDLATLDVLSRFARGTRKTSMLILGTYRAADSASGGHKIRRLHQDLEIHGCCVELRLDRLSRTELERYVALRFHDAELASALSGPVFERTQGHPLFVTSMLQHFIDQQTIVEMNGAWRLSSQAAYSQDGIPNNLSNMITYELGRLSEEERRLLDVASVAGEGFSAALVAAGLSRDAVDVERDCEALVRKDRILVRSGVSEWPDGTYSGSYSFGHILYQNVIYQHLAPGQRAQTHRRLGQRLEEAYAGRASEIASVLALHFEQGRDFEGALRSLGQAAESSTKRLGHAEAASYLTRALGILDRFDAADQVAMRIALLRQRSWALRSSGDLAGSVSDLQAMIACAEQAREIKQQVNGLLAVSMFSLRVDRRACLQASEDVLAKSQTIEDETFKALVQGTSASVSLYLNGWREQDAALCTKALELTAGARNYGTLIRRYSIQGILDCWRSRYPECRRSGAEGKRLARAIGDIYTFVLFNVLESIALMHLGEWRELQREITLGIELATRNANEPGRALSRLTLAWLHVEAMDFEGARDLCESVDDSLLVDEQSTFFHKRTVLAKAFVGLNDPMQARRQFDEIQRRMDEHGINVEFTAGIQLYHCFGEYHLLIGDLAQARKWADHLHDYVAPAPDRNHLAQAHGLLARIAFAAGDSRDALRHLSNALEIVDNADFPLASWRVYSAAAEIFAQCGETEKADACLIRFVNVLRRLAQNFEPNDRLHKSLLTALAVRTAQSGLAI
jgi:DNA-binding winged helix-turn-helix (wHTH) protein/tetratricopeptide (TPR) repeat protein